MFTAYFCNPDIDLRQRVYEETENLESVLQMMQVKFQEQTKRIRDLEDKNSKLVILNGQQNNTIMELTGKVTELTEINKYNTQIIMSRDKQMCNQNGQIKKLVNCMESNKKQIKNLEDENSKLVTLNGQQNNTITELKSKITNLTKINKYNTQIIMSRDTQICNQHELEQHNKQNNLTIMADKLKIKELESELQKLSETLKCSDIEYDNLIDNYNRDMLRKGVNINILSLLDFKKRCYETKKRNSTLEFDNKQLILSIEEDKVKIKTLETEIQQYVEKEQLSTRSLSNYIKNGFTSISKSSYTRQKLRTRRPTYIFWDLENVHEYTIFKDNELDNIMIFGFIGKLNRYAHKDVGMYNIMKFIVESVRRDACDTYMMVYVTKLLERVQEKVNIIIITRDHFAANLIESLNDYNNSVVDNILHITTSEECYKKVLTLV